MRTLLVIGIGVGDPDQLTFQAAAALHRADVVFVPDKGSDKADLKALRLAILERHPDPTGNRRVVELASPERERYPADYGGTVADWHERIAVLYRDLFSRELEEGACGAFLVWGDPSLYDSTLRVLEAVRQTGLALKVEVFPGISAVQLLAARHGIALNRVGEPVLLTTGRRLEQDFPGHRAGAVVLLDGEQAFAKLDPAGVEIFWGAYLGSPDEILVAGPLEAVRDEILAKRAEARARKGWIMDTYLVRSMQKRF